MILGLAAAVVSWLTVIFLILIATDAVLQRHHRRVVEAHAQRRRREFVAERQRMEREALRLSLELRQLGNRP